VNALLMGIEASGRSRHRTNRRNPELRRASPRPQYGCKLKLQRPLGLASSLQAAAKGKTALTVGSNPVTPAAPLATGLEAIVGQLYLAVVVATLVGRVSARRDRSHSIRPHRSQVVPVTRVVP
jgi:hypothetical protein